MINSGKARRYCSEDISLIENYDKAAADTTQTWHIHHRGEILPCGNYSRETLKKYNLYWNRPAAELIFLTHGEHMRLHNLGEKNPFFGKTHSTETLKKMSQAQNGEKNPFFGKTHSDESRKKMSRALSGENNPNFGTHYWNDGTRSIRAKTCPPGFVRGRL